MQQKGNIKERWKKCPKCGYEWLARTTKPPRCPSNTCQYKFEYPQQFDNLCSLWQSSSCKHQGEEGLPCDKQGEGCVYRAEVKA